MSDQWEKADGRLGKGAVWYARERNWKILPVHGIDRRGKCTCGRDHREPKEIGKHPVYSGWNTDATDNVEQVEKWWAENGDYNVGVYCKGSGFLVIDIDPRSGGNTSFLKLEELAKGALPPTVEAITGEYRDSDTGELTRGRHLIYRCSDTERFMGNFKSAGLEGIDIKHNGYVVLSPSRHYSGFIYEWKPNHAPWEIEVAEAPEDLLAVLRGKSSKTASRRSTPIRYSDGNWEAFEDLEYNGEKVDIKKMLAEGLVEGERTVQIYRLACALANKYKVKDDGDASFIETAMIRFNAEKVNPPLPLDGTDGVIYQVNRAIEFVRQNPIERKSDWNDLEDWVKTSGLEWARKISNAPLGQDIATIDEEDSSDDYSEEMPDNYVGESVRKLAESGESAVSISTNGNLNVPKDIDALSVEDGGTPGRRSLTDLGNGRRLVDTYESVVRYSEGLGWFYWDGNYWKPDGEQLEVTELSKRIAAVVASEVRHHMDDETKRGEIINWAKQTKSVSRISNMIKSANSDRRIRVPVNKWDSEDHLLGVRNGVINLKTGELMTGRPDLSITKRAAVAYTEGMRNIRWSQFLEHATGGDKEYEDWLQRAVGYTISGMNTQDKFFLVYGPPGSGKNTFVETIFNALGHSDYSMMLDSNVLLSGDGKKDASDQYYMAELRGKRMVWVDELPEGDRIKENQIKKMTGSMNLTGRSPGEKPFTFNSHAKLWITTNHRPIITDEAMWRRLMVLPLVNIPKTPDPNLKEYLSDPEGGLPAVLSWAVEGAVRYYNWSSSKDALDPCSVIAQASEGYKKTEDRIGAFLSEVTYENEGGSVKITDLFNIYRQWSDGRNEKALTKIAFDRKLADRGLPIEGEGTKAVIKNMSRIIEEAPVVPTAPAGDGQNWSAIMGGLNL